jgi:hypothetical protein
MNRRQLLAATPGLALAAVGVSLLIDGGPGPEQSMGANAAESSSLPLMAHQLAAGGWQSHLLPFAAPFPSQAALALALAEARRLHLFI